jgi:hypothetical protein
MSLDEYLGALKETVKIMDGLQPPYLVSQRETQAAVHIMGVGKGFNPICFKPTKYWGHPVLKIVIPLIRLSYCINLGEWRASVTDPVPRTADSHPMK